MSSAPSQTRFRVPDLLQYIMVYTPDSEESIDDWSSRQANMAKIGDVFTVFKPHALFSKRDDLLELEVDGVALVFGEDADLPMNFFIDDQTYEMSFLEGLLSSKGTAARDEGQAFYCLRSTMTHEFGKEILSRLGLMRKLGGTGERKTPANGFMEPICHFISAFGLKYDPSMEHDPVKVLDFASSLWGDGKDRKDQRGLKLHEHFVGVVAENGGLQSLLPELKGASAAGTAAKESEGSNSENVSAGTMDGANTVAETEASAAPNDGARPDVPPGSASVPPASKESAAQKLVNEAANAASAAPKKEDNDVWDMLSSKSKPSEAQEESSELKNLFQKTSESQQERNADFLKSEHNSGSLADSLFGSSSDELFSSENLFAAKPVQDILADSSDNNSFIADSSRIVGASDDLPAAEVKDELSAAKPDDSPASSIAPGTESPVLESPVLESPVLESKETESAISEVDQATESLPSEATEALVNDPAGLLVEPTESQANDKSASPLKEESAALEKELSKADDNVSVKSQVADDSELSSSSAAGLGAKWNGVFAGLDDMLSAPPKEKVKETSEQSADPRVDAVAAAATDLADGKVDAISASASAIESADANAKTNAKESANASNVSEKSTVENSVESTSSNSIEESPADLANAEPEQNKTDLKDKLRAQAKGNEDLLARKDLPTRQKIEMLLAKQKAAALQKAKAKASENAAAGAPASGTSVTNESDSGSTITPSSDSELAGTSSADSDLPEVEKSGSADDSNSDVDKNDGQADGSVAQPQKKLSLQATLAKLEEQTQKANQRLEEFRKNHEQVCRDDLQEFEKQSSNFETEFKERLNSARKEIVVKMRLLSLQSSEKLSLIADEGKVRIEERGPLSLKELETAGHAIDFRSVDGDLKKALDSFASLVSERLSVLNLLSEGKNPLNAIVDEELSKLREWRGTRLQTYIELFEEISARFEARSQSISSLLDNSTNTMKSELESMRDFEVKSLDGLRSQLNEPLISAQKLSELRMKRDADKVLAEKIFPLIAEMKISLAARTAELRADMAAKLQEQSRESEGSLSLALKAGKTSLVKIADEIAKLKSAIPEKEKQGVTDRLAKFSSYLDELLKELKKSAQQAQSGESSAEDSFDAKAKEVGKNCSREIEETHEQLESNANEHSKNVLAGVQSRGDTAQEQLLAKLKGALVGLNESRQDSLKKLDERLDQLAESVEAMSSQLIQ